MVDLVVETGEGLINANGLVSVEFVKNYWSQQMRDPAILYDDVTEQTDNIESSIVRASRYLSESFRWKGYRRKNRPKLQGLAWPRIGVVDREGYSIPDNEIPREIQWAASEIAWQEYNVPYSVTNPSYTPSDRVKSERAGPVAVTYDLSRTDPESVRPVLLSVRDLIGEYLERGGVSRIQGNVTR